MNPPDPAAPARAGPFDILLVEDDVPFRHLLARVLRRETEFACVVDEADSGDGCLEACRKKTYDLVMMDYSLPGRNGLEVLKELKQSGYAAAVVIVTGMGSEEVAVRAMKLGAYDYIVKGGDVTLLVPLVARKVLEKIALERCFEQAQRDRAKLLELDRMKSEFIANVSHELRTPVVSIRGYTEMLLEERLGPLTEAQRKGLTISLRNVDRLIGRIDALLLLSRLESGRRKLDRSAFSLREMLDAIRDDAAPLCEKKGIRFVLDPPEGDPVVFADEVLIDEVFANLIGNALKFTERGEIRVSCHPPADGRVPVTVRDTGSGIPEALQTHVFERFWQQETGATRKFGGLGIGLAIVKEILDAHGMSLWLKSREGKGTEVGFTLPLTDQPPGPKRRRGGGWWRSGKLPAMARESPPKRVLVIDDEPDIRTLVKTALEGEGYVVYAAASGASGLEFLEQRTVDAILLDIAMEDMDGLEVLRRIRSNPALKQIPVHILTAVAPERIKDECLAEGAAGVLVKPFETRVLFQALAGAPPRKESPAT